MFEADGEKNRFLWPRMSHVNPGTGVQFGSAEKAIKGSWSSFSFICLTMFTRIGSILAWEMSDDEENQA
jgi:hypothetical protein